MENINSLRPGTILKGEQSYRIESVLGAGGFGITYLAQTSVMFGNIPVNVRVAVKEHFVGDYCERQHDGATVVCVGTQKVRDMVERSLKDFLSEARRLSAVSAKHPNIVKVNEIIEANGTAYYVMEYLSGKSLWDYIREHGPLTEEETRSLMLPIVDASAYLHASDMTHLDIKPQNIMLTDDNGTLKPVLIDFGLSKHYTPDGSPTSTVNTLACSDGYSPVEQYSGITTFSPAADVYALGATILTCLTGRIPTVSTNWPLGEPSRTIDALPISEDLKEILKKSMSPAAHGRYADSGALYRALNSQQTADTDILSSETKVKDNISLETKVKSQTQEERLLQSGHSEPENLDLEAKLPDGRIVYFNQTEWSNLSPEDQSNLDKNGVVIIKDRQQFVLSLECTEEMTWDEAMRRYGNQMPTKEQGEALASQYENVNAAIRAYGGYLPEDLTWYWTKVEFNSSNAWGVTIIYGYVNPYLKYNTHRVRPVARVAEACMKVQPQTQEERLRQSGHSIGKNLDLAVRLQDGSDIFFNQEEWSALPSDYKTGLKKSGVVIIKDGEAFVLSLEYTEKMTWDEAMRRYGKHMPSMEQGKTISSQYEAVKAAIRAYGGEMPNDNFWYWTNRERDSVYAWFYHMNSRAVDITLKTDTYRVRTVTNIPGRTGWA